MDKTEVEFDGGVIHAGYEVRCVLPLRLGTLRQREEIAPTRQIWTRSRVEWLEGVAALAAVDKQG